MMVAQIGLGGYSWVMGRGRFRPNIKYRVWRSSYRFVGKVMRDGRGSNFRMFEGWFGYEAFAEIMDFLRGGRVQPPKGWHCPSSEPHAPHLWGAELAETRYRDSYKCVGSGKLANIGGLYYSQADDRVDPPYVRARKTKDDLWQWHCPSSEPHAPHPWGAELAVCHYRDAYQCVGSGSLAQPHGWT
jgi:hypothetical protein